MTPGQLALIEAARLESARVYGGIVSGKKSRPLLAERAEAEVIARIPGREVDPAIEAIRAGATTHEVMERYGLTYQEVRATRKKTMGGAA